MLTKDASAVFSSQVIGEASAFYQLFLGHQYCDKGGLREIWETYSILRGEYLKEIGELFDLKEGTHQSQLLKEQSLKPGHLHQICGSVSPLCWRVCSTHGTYLHMWWECQIVSKFWGDVSYTISNFLNFTVVKDAKLALLPLFKGVNKKHTIQTIDGSLPCGCSYGAYFSAEERLSIN